MGERCVCTDGLMDSLENGNVAKVNGLNEEQWLPVCHHLQHRIQIRGLEPSILKWAPSLCIRRVLPSVIVLFICVHSGWSWSLLRDRQPSRARGLQP